MRKALFLSIYCLFFAGSMMYPSTLYFLILFFLVPIFAITDSDLGDSKKLNKISLYFFIATVVGFFLSTSWMVSAHPFDWLQNSPSSLFSMLTVFGVWLVMVVSFSILPTIWFILTCFLTQKSVFVRFSLIACLWVLMEFFRSYVGSFLFLGKQSSIGLHHTYYSLGYVVSQIPVLRDLLAVGGLYLASFFVVVLNACIYYLYTYRKLAHRYVYLFFIIIFLIVGSSMCMQYLREKDSPIDVDIILVNTHIAKFLYKNVEDQKKETVMSFLKTGNLNNRLIVIPENIALFSDTQIISLPEGSVVISSMFGNLFFAEQKVGKSFFYKKQLLMPLGEYDFRGLDTLLKLFGSSVNAINPLFNLVTKGGSTFVYKHKKFNIGGSVCSENISPYIYRNQTKAGATFFVHVSSLSPFHGSDLLNRQMYALSASRAIENGRYFVSSSNFGNSFIISDSGKMMMLFSTTSPIESRDVIIKNKQYMTPYVKFGDYVVVFVVCYCLVIVVWLPRNRILK